MNNGPYHKPEAQAYRVAYLIAGYIRNTLTEKEHQELAAWVDASDENMRLFEDLTDEGNVQANLMLMDKVQTEQSLQKLKESGVLKKRKSVITAGRLLVAAAGVTLILGLFIVYRASKDSTEPNKKLAVSDSLVLNPGQNRATLTLSDGSVINLGEIQNGPIENGQHEISKISDGEIVYANSPAGIQQGTNTLTTPAGGQYQVTLPDGTQVWLNASSSIRYPVNFGEQERKVFVTGETYFHVAKDPSRPFRVVAADVTVEALGTQFNVNAYADEPFIAATLVEGSVLVSKQTHENILQPGQQAQLHADDFGIVKVDVDNVTAWKDHQFKFSNTPLDVIMRQIQRWYDADIVYQEKPNLHLNATIERNVPVTRILNLLEQTNQVHFKVTGKKIIVMK